MSNNHQKNRQLPAAGRQNWIGLMGEWRRRHASRRELQRLDHHMALDIGLDRGLVLIEAAKPFWKV